MSLMEVYTCALHVLVLNKTPEVVNLATPTSQGDTITGVILSPRTYLIIIRYSISLNPLGKLLITKMICILLSRGNAPM